MNKINSIIIAIIALVSISFADCICGQVVEVGVYLTTPYITIQKDPNCTQCSTASVTENKIRIWLSSTEPANKYVTSIALSAMSSGLNVLCWAERSGSELHFQNAGGPCISVIKN